MPEFYKVLIGVAGLFVLPTVVSAAAGGIAALFAMKSVISALTGAIGTMFGAINASKILDDILKLGAPKTTPPVGATAIPKTTPTSKLSKLGNLLKLGGKAIPYLGTLIGGYQGVTDEGLKDAGYSNAFDRAALGILEGTLDLFDMGQNALGQAFNWGFGTDFRTDYDLSGAFRDAMTDPEVVRWMTDPIKTLLGEGNPTDTSVTEVPEPPSQLDQQTPMKFGNTEYKYSPPNPTKRGFATQPVVPKEVFTTPEVTAQPQLTAPELGTVNDVLSAESVALETQEMFRALSENIKPGITQQQADEITRYLKAIADNTDQ